MAALVMLSLGAGCGQPDPAQGSEGGACYGNDTCDGALVCLSALCVMPATSLDMAADDMRAPGDMSPGADLGRHGQDMNLADLAGEQDMSAPVEEMGAVDLGDEDMPRDMSEVEDLGVMDMMVPPDMEPSLAEVDEQEPNNGATLTEFNAITAGQAMRGALSTPGDTDLFKLDAVAGRVYQIDLIVENSRLQGHLTAIDGGRDGDSPGEDYVKIALDPASQGGSMTIFAMGQGGYIFAVRDRRAVSQMQMVGSPMHTYRLEVRELPLASVEGAALAPPQTFQDQLGGASSVRVYPFTTATQGEDWVMDLTSASMQFDGRLHVYSQMTGDWIARNDNREVGGRDPGIDAPLFAAGMMWLVVENITPEATSLGYSLSVSRN